MDKEKKQTANNNTTSKKKNTTKKKEQIMEKKNTKANKPEKEIKKKGRELITDDNEEYNEDLEDDFVEEVSTTQKQKKQETKKENIEKIERIAKEKSKKNKTSSNSKISDFLLVLDKYHTAIYSFIGGVLITTLIVFIIWPDRIATLKDGTQPVVKVGDVTYTADDLYENMKDYYSVSLLLDQIDTDLLSELYPEDDEMLEEVNSNAEYYLNMYQQYYGYTEEEFLEKNGFSSYNSFLEYLKLDYRRDKYLDKYIEDNLTDDEIQKYYDENVVGDINTQHILVEVASDSDSEDDSKLSDEDAKALAEEIITKLNDGTSWEQIQEDYKDQVTYEDLSYQSWDASLEESFLTALKNMEDNSYSTEPVQTSYGYHVIYRLDQKEKPSFEDSKEKIIDNLLTDKKSEDSDLLYKALISLRSDNNIEFSDTVMKSKYESYCKQYK